MDIQTELDELESTVNWLETQWTGEAADAYLVAKRTWIRDMSNNRSTLNEVYSRA